MRHLPLTAAIFVVLCALQAATPAAAQNYPSRPIRVVVPYPPGGITDVTTRIVAQELSKNIQQNVLVDNRPGANSILGVEIVSKANADGYTLASVIAAHAANQTLYPKLPYDAVKSFATVSLLATAPLIVCANNSLPAKDAKELVALAKAKPGTLSFGSSGIGAAAHLTTELLMLTMGVKMTHVPYKGTAPALQGLMSGEIQLLMDTPSSMLPHVRSYTASLAIIDEADLCDDLGALLNAVKPTIDAGGQLILISTADKSKPLSPFKEIYRAAQAGANDYRHVFLPWDSRPDRSLAWYDAQRRDVLARTGALDDLQQEYPAVDIEALAPRSLYKRFPAEWLAGCADVRHGSNGLGVHGLTVYEEPKEGRRHDRG